MSVYSLEPVYQERIWGGTNLHTLFGRQLPADQLIGEAWELSDRPGAQSQVTELGKSLHELWAGPDRKKLFGSGAPDTELFPILIKLLDAQDKLSLQVHPPAALAPRFKGDPKTEMWYFLETTPEACIYAGLKNGVTRESFTAALAQGRVADCFHSLSTTAGETMFLPSGRVHAIGAGNVILEVQQNSDTTFRVYDWDRVDAKTGQPRALHVAESLECINFRDYTPAFAQPHGRRVVGCEYFSVYRSLFDEKGQVEDLMTDGTAFYYLFVSQGSFRIGGSECPRGTSRLVTAEPGEIELESLQEFGEVILVTWPE